MVLTIRSTFSCRRINNSRLRECGTTMCKNQKKTEKNYVQLHTRVLTVLYSIMATFQSIVSCPVGKFFENPSGNIR